MSKYTGHMDKDGKYIEPIEDILLNHREFIGMQDDTSLDAISTSVVFETTREEDELKRVEFTGKLQFNNGCPYDKKTYTLYFNSEEFIKDMYKLNRIIDTLQEYKEVLFDAFNKKDELDKTISIDESN